MITVPSDRRGTVILGFEQANKYTVLDQDGATVALMAEDEGSLGKGIGRQLLRTHRAFTATIFSPDGAHPPSLSTPNPNSCRTIARLKRWTFVLSLSEICEGWLVKGLPIHEQQHNLCFGLRLRAREEPDRFHVQDH